ncbi:MAG: hypothetical protein KDB23_27710, partial [Planctomycetales bacterium]|nr:hypothetical protein [Planctomycetales bacterium]
VVDVQDERGPRDNPHGFFNLAAIDDVYDYNRDRYVNATDQIIARNHATSLIERLRLLGTESPSDAPIRFVYDPTTGRLSVISEIPITTLEIQSQTGVFDASSLAGQILPPFDVATPNKVFVLKTAGFYDFYVDLPVDLTEEFLRGDLSIQGSVLPGGGLGNWDFVVLETVEPTVVTYDAAIGQLSVDSPYSIASLTISSSRGSFTGQPAQGLAGPDDVDTDTLLLKHDLNGFTELDLGNVLETGLTGTFLSQDLTISGQLVDGQLLQNVQLVVVPQEDEVRLIYDAATGEFQLETNAPIESLDVISKSYILQVNQAHENLAGPDDVLTTARLHKVAADGFRNVSFGVVAQTGWTESFVATDLTITGRLLGGDPIENIELVVLPEPVLTQFIYDANTGELSIESALSLTTLQIISASGIFTGSPAANLGAEFDVDTDVKVFKVEPAGFSNLSLGPVARAGLPRSFLERDLSIDGSRAAGGRLGQFELVVIPAADQTSVVYDAVTGEWFVEANPPLSSLDLVSTRGIFTGATPQSLDGPTDIDSDTRIYKQDDAGFSDLVLGTVTEAGLTHEFLATDVTMSAISGAGAQSPVELLVVPLKPDVKVIHDEATGGFRVQTNVPLESLALQSAAGIFTGAPAEHLGGPSDVDTDTQIVRQDERGFREFSFGNVVPPGLDPQFVTSDITISGTLLGGQSLEQISFEVIPDLGVTTLTYNASNGNVRVTTNLSLNSLEIVSARGIFTGEPA